MPQPPIRRRRLLASASALRRGPASARRGDDRGGAAPRRGDERRGERGGDERGGDERGGAVSLWVVLMVPVSAFAAVVAMAGPQRLAAEWSMDEAAADLSVMAVAWRDGQGDDHGVLAAFPPECSTGSLQTHFDADIERYEVSIATLEDEIDQLGETETRLEQLAEAKAGYRESTGGRDLVLSEWGEACELLFETLLRDLGIAGVDMGSLEGIYGDSLTTAEMPGNPGTLAVPCLISPRVEVHDAVHVALAADWANAGWAAAQVWPDGIRMGAESIGRIRRNVRGSTVAEDCGNRLDVADAQGRPVSLQDPDAVSRRLSQSAPDRTVFEG